MNSIFKISTPNTKDIKIIKPLHYKRLENAKWNLPPEEGNKYYISIVQ